MPFVVDDDLAELQGRGADHRVLHGVIAFAAVLIAGGGEVGARHRPVRIADHAAVAVAFGHFKLVIDLVVDVPERESRALLGDREGSVQLALGLVAIDQQIFAGTQRQVGKLIAVCPAAEHQPLQRDGLAALVFQLDPVRKVVAHSQCGLVGGHDLADDDVKILGDDDLFAPARLVSLGRGGGVGGVGVELRPLLVGQKAAGGQLDEHAEHQGKQYENTDKAFHGRLFRSFPESNHSDHITYHISERSAILKSSRFFADCPLIFRTVPVKYILFEADYTLRRKIKNDL